MTLANQVVAGAATNIAEDLKRVPAHAPGVVFVDLAALADNWRGLRDFVQPAECGAVVKADAYGLGAQQVIPTLSAAGCKTFFVATTREAGEARALAPDARIFVLDGLLPGAAADVAACGSIPILSTLAETREWAGYAKSHGADGKLSCGIHIDTGLNRLGLEPDEVRFLAGDADTLAHLDLKLVMSHMACADEPDHAMNRAQLGAFQSLRQALGHIPASLAASDGLMLGAGYHFDIVRPGYALYGGQAFQGGRTPVSRVVGAYSRVLQVRDAKPGETVGYSASYRFDRETRVAVLALGYADGFARMASRSSEHGPAAAGGGADIPYVCFAGQRAPIIGRVSMDLITVDITDIEGVPIARGDWAEIIGPNVSLEEVGIGAQTIGYEVLTRLGRRFHRAYGGGAPSFHGTVSEGSG